MEDIRRRSIRSTRTAPQRALIVPERSVATQVVAGKPYLALDSSNTVAQQATPKQVVSQTPALPRLNFTPAPSSASFTVGWNPDITLSPSLQTLHLPKGRRAIKQFGIGLVASTILLLSLYVSFDALQTNNQAKEQFGSSSSGQVASATTAPESKVDESKPPTDWLKNYVVAPDLPRIITIPSQNAAARVTRQGMAADGTLQTPKNIYDTGWYEGSSKPGQGGAVLIDGHATGPTASGVFDNLDKLTPGQAITIERGDGHVLTYIVKETKIMPAQSVNMAQLLLPYQPGAKGLNLISCTGDYDAKTNTYADRVIVFAVQQ